MSRGPGRMMRAALAELDSFGEAKPWTVALRAAHDAQCGRDVAECIGDFQHRATRAELVSARRALHKLAADGVVELSREWEPGPRVGPSGLKAKRCQLGTAGNTYKPAEKKTEPKLLPESLELGWREVDRCDSCARLFSEIGIASTFRPTDDPVTYQVRGLALCRDCDDGLIDPIGLASRGEYAIDRMSPIPCGECGGELSEAGLRRVYINGARLPLCDQCMSRRTGEDILRTVGPDHPFYQAYISASGAPGVDR